MSRGTIYDKQKELKEKEGLLISDLNLSGERIKKIALWSLLAGIVGFVFYGIFTSLFPFKKKKSKKKKVKKKVPKDYPMLDSLIEQGASRLGNWIENEFGDSGVKN